MYNRAILVGRISTDLELKETTNGTPYCRFNLAVNRVDEGTDFIPIKVWKKQAENLIQYQSKGSLILVEGLININNYIDDDGNNRTYFEVVAQNIQFLESKKKNEVIRNDEIDNTYMEEDNFDIDDNFLE